MARFEFQVTAADLESASAYYPLKAVINNPEE
jgi:hypothetical protein